MTQTLRERLQIVIDAIDAVEAGVLVKFGTNGEASVRPYEEALLFTNCEISRIPKPPETISGTYADGTKWEINAPRREAPAEGVKYFYARPDGETESAVWEGDAFDKLILADCNCWRTEDDAQAWADVSRRLRGGV